MDFMKIAPVIARSVFRDEAISLLTGRLLRRASALLATTLLFTAAVSGTSYNPTNSKWAWTIISRRPSASQEWHAARRESLSRTGHWDYRSRQLPHRRPRL